MAKMSAHNLAWRKGQKRGAIMKPSTFKDIEHKAMMEGMSKESAAKVAGRAYWNTEKKKYRDRKKK